MFSRTPYNYPAFTREMMQREQSLTGFPSGPKPGERAPDFRGRTLDGDQLRLNDYRGRKNVVLTFGSATCPMTAGSLPGMNELFREYTSDDVQFLLVYVREAHPGDELPAHRSMDDKAYAADILRGEEEVEMPIVLDDLRGSIHSRYGKLPNPTYIIDKTGRVAFRSLATDPEVVEEALQELLEHQAEYGDKEHVTVRGGEDTRLSVVYPMLRSFRALERGGSSALDNFRQQMGTPGRAALAVSGTVESFAPADGTRYDPVKIFAGVVLGVGAVAAGVYAGQKLRKRRLGLRDPRPYYDYPEHADDQYSGTDGYGVGI